MSEFIKETRYIVLKLSKMTDSEKQVIYRAIQHAEISSDATPECVVVESDWPNYQDTWSDIQAIFEGDFASKAELKQRNQRLEGQNAELVAQVEVVKQDFDNKDKFANATYRELVSSIDVIVEREKEITELTARNAELVAQVDAYRATLEYFVSEKFEWNDPHDSMIDDIHNLLDLPPTQHLRDVKAEAVLVAANSCLFMADINTDDGVFRKEICLLEDLQQYAELAKSGEV